MSLSGPSLGSSRRIVVIGKVEVGEGPTICVFSLQTLGIWLPVTMVGGVWGSGLLFPVVIALEGSG